MRLTLSALVSWAASADAQPVFPIPTTLPIPFFRFAAFYVRDLEITPGPATLLHGRVHTNGDLYLDANPGPLRIYCGRKDTSQCSGTVWIDTPVDVVPPLGDLDERPLACSGAGTSR